MTRAAMVMAVLALAGCQRPDDADKARLDDLAARVTVLEQRQLELRRVVQAKPGESTTEPSQPVAMWAFEDGPSSHRYATKERCEAALEAFEANRVAQDAASGVTVVRGTKATCNPV